MPGGPLLPDFVDRNPFGAAGSDRLRRRCSRLRRFQSSRIARLRVTRSRRRGRRAIARTRRAPALFITTRVFRIGKCAHAQFGLPVDAAFCRNLQKPAAFRTVDLPSQRQWIANPKVRQAVRAGEMKRGHRNQRRDRLLLGESSRGGAGPVYSPREAFRGKGTSLRSSASSAPVIVAVFLCSSTINTSFRGVRM